MTEPGQGINGERAGGRTQCLGAGDWGGLRGGSLVGGDLKQARLGASALTADLHPEPVLSCVRCR